ncbi:acyl-CoA reductase [Enterococcus pseudoavium]|uniref:long-chain-fatty-acyl-CoA reductase n=1 Tax=Enterococcus pseudoavium TaxID=44007 RepID=A0ABU3FE45_9ENTE|nr:acyl-CoA reductase [Enterococcus pseudoavium]MDT2754631.1 acyl-CoA reductase [Enterococcus pseudoavium]MDT2769313.1 acyl-CoA reductase [Enterococcus pseudoavium]
MWMYRGNCCNEDQLPELLAGLSQQVNADLALELPLRPILQALDQLGTRLLQDPLFLMKELANQGMSEEQIQAAKAETAAILDQRALTKKITRELGVLPGELERINEENSVLEGWLPKGVLGHVTSSNDPFIGFLSLVEGLITGNINLVKTSLNSSEIPLLLCQELVRIEPRLASRLYIFPLSSKNKTAMGQLFACCDTIAVWGSENAVKGVKELAPAGIEIVSWGHRISFAYFTPAGKNSEKLKHLAQEVCLNEQQACSAPQVVYYETQDQAELVAFAEELAASFAEILPRYPQMPLETAEQAEITTQIELAKLAELMGDQKVLVGENYRLLIKFDSQLEASPLYRTLLIKPLQREKIIPELRPFRQYLQTVGLSCAPHELAEISTRLYAVGVSKLTDPGKMLTGYIGEPHDGRYALAHYVKRVSLTNQELPTGLALLSEMQQPQKLTIDQAVLSKEAFVELAPQKEAGQLIIKSGGSSGKSVYAYHSYADAEETYRSAAHAMLAAGMNASDTVMNLFYGGELYGGFISMYEAVKSVGATQLPMQAVADLEFVSAEIIKQQANVLIGMPTYLNKLFSEEGERLKKYGGIQKVLYGGEQYDPQLQRHRETTLGISIHSITYGCNEIGTIGYACECCANSEHHLHPSKYLEILAMDKDEAVKPGEVGRLVLTPVNQEATSVKRYEIGDLGRMVLEPCGCGRQTPKFELLGRFGDQFKFATNLVNYQKFQQILATEYAYHGNLQLVVDYHGETERLRIITDQLLPDLSATLEKTYPEIAETLRGNSGLIENGAASQTRYQLSSSGKIRRVVDQRVER